MKDMQKMNKKTGVLLGISVGAAGLVAAACSSEPSSNTPITPTASTTTTVPTPPPSTPPTSPSVTPPTPGSVTPTTPTTTGSTTAPTTPMSTCTSVDYAADNNDLASADFPGVVAYYGYGDMMTSLCSGTATTPSGPGKLCVEGNAVSSKGADNDYQYYGAGVGLQMVVATDGVADAPWDATAAGVVSVRFTASELAGRKVRVQMSQANDPADPTKVYQDNSFLWGGTKYASKELAAGDDGVITIPLAEFALPEWSADTLGLEADLALDPTKIYALSFQIANNPSDDTELYSFCIANLEWLDAAGAPVDVMAPDPTSTGGDTGSDTGAAASGDSSAPAPSGSASGDSSAPADSSGADTGAAVNFQADVQPIFTASCTAAACHDGDAPARGINLTSAEPNATLADEILRAVKREQGIDPMPPPPAAALGAEQIATIEAWVNSL